MKKFMDISALSCIGILMLSGCVEENFEKPGIPEGDGIVFGATAGYAGPETKTEYGDYVTDEITGEKRSQVINWVQGDQVEIYSPTSPYVNQTEYNVATGGSNTSYLTSESGLQWASDATQDFYAIYPSIASIQNDQIRGLTSFKDGVLTGYIPINQQHTITKVSGGYVAKPNMDYMYMAARKQNFAVPADGTAEDGISLDFIPLTTTLEITLVGPTQAPLAQLNVQSNNGARIAGLFECDLKAGTECKVSPSSTVRDVITVNLYDSDGKPLKLEPGEKVTFNVFLLPVDELSDLSIRVAGLNSSARTMHLVKPDGTGNIVLSPNKKTCVTISAPQIGPNENNEWISAIDDNVLISQLSIPGTANSFSYRYEGTNKATYSTQLATFDEQWNAGIRCFELTGSEVQGSLESGRLLCNRQDIGMSFGEAVDMIWGKVQNTGEFAIIIPSYDSDTGHPADHNGVNDYANALNTFFDEHGSYKYQTFTRDLTVGEARGSLIFIARITSEEDSGYELPAPHQGTFVDEWGSLKDNWARRGYTVNGSVVNNWATRENDPQSVEYYWHCTNVTQSSDEPSTPPAVPSTEDIKRDEEQINFIHTSHRAGSAGTGQAYIQDWQRVVPGDGVVDGLRSGMFYLGSERGSWNWGEAWWNYTHHYYYWPESLTEKKDHIWKTFETSIAENSDKTNDTFFINSLDGYFVDPTIEKSYKPYVDGGEWGAKLSDGGTEGNIKAYANHINDWFYREILRYGEDNIYGPLNIILMDRVYQTEGSQYLPSTIINNNFRFPLLTSEDMQSASDYDASYSAGGNVWE